MRFSGKLWAAIAILAIAAMVTQAALAQNEQGRRGRGNRGGGPGGPGGGVSMARLATIDKVQDALKLSDEQKSKLEKINAESREQMQKVIQDGGRPDPEKMRKMRESTSEKMNEVLDEGQRKRLTGIFIQIAGVGAVMDPAVAKELNITDDQKSKLREAMGGMREGGSGDNQSFAERRAKMDKELTAVLTSEQQQKLDSLKGEKVDIDMSQLRSPGGDRRPGRGRERGNRGNDQPNEKKSAA